MALNAVYLNVLSAINRQQFAMPRFFVCHITTYNDNKENRIILLRKLKSSFVPRFCPQIPGICR